MTTTDYQKQATDFLERFGFTFKAEFIGKNCPPWSGSDHKNKRSCPKCGSVHGWEYLITIGRGRASLSFPYWNSWADTHVDFPKGRDFQGGVQWFMDKDTAPKPTAYEALACISGDANCPADFAEFCADYGYDTDSRKAEAMHRRSVEFALKLRQFFTNDELEALSEIR